MLLQGESYYEAIENQNGCIIHSNIKDLLLVIKGHIVHLRETVLSERDKMLLSRSTRVHSNRQQAFQSSNNKTGLFWIFVRLLFHFFPFLVWNDSLKWEKHRKCENKPNSFLWSQWVSPSVCLFFLYLWNLTLAVHDQKRHVVDLILDHKVLLFSLEVLQTAM